MNVLETDRLRLRWMSVADAEFILKLLNEPSWLRFIGDRGVRTVEQAEDYILNGPVEMYNRLGFGLYMVDLKEEDTPIGLCGLIKRDFLADVDIGFGFLPRYWGCGYAYEASIEVMAYGRDVLGLKRIVAIATADNKASTKLLNKLGLQFEKVVRYPSGENLHLFGINF